MNNILIITSRCYEDAHADGICGKNLKLGFEQNRNNVFLLGYSSIENSEYVLKSNERCFYHTKNKKKISHLNSLSKVFKPNFDKELCDKYYKNACNIIEKENINIVVGVYFPLETLIALNKLKQKYKYIKTVSYEVDSAIDIDSYSSKLGKYHINSYIKYLNYLYKNINYILIMKCHLNKFNKTYPLLATKVKEIDSPVLLDYTFLNRESNKNTIDFYYTGYLDKDNYSPIPFLELFEINKDKNNWRLHFYSRGNCEEMIAQACKNDSRIIQHGYVNEVELNNAIGKADIFLSIDNTAKLNSIPSKVFKFFGMCKPIIHFIDKESYFSKNYLSFYKLGLIVKKDDMKKKNDSILIFVDKTIKNQNIKYDDVKELYFMNTPTFSAKIICELK